MPYMCTVCETNILFWDKKMRLASFSNNRYKADIHQNCGIKIINDYLKRKIK